jgi:hypothetical protein
MEDLYPNIWASLRILLTTPVSVASGERRFPNSFIKTYLRSSMLHERLSSVAVLSAEITIAQNLHLSELVKTFEDVEAGKVNFL